MEQYYFFLVLWFAPFIIGGIWFAARDSALPETIKAPYSLPHDITAENADELMVHKYWYTNPQNALLSKLEKVDTLEPEMRAINYMDHWYKRNTELLMHDGECLAYINHYGHLGDTFWKNINSKGIKPQKDEKFQRLLVSVYYNAYTNAYCENFSNLLFRYAKYWSLMPKVRHILETDERFASTKDTYEFGHSYAS